MQKELQQEYGWLSYCCSCKHKHNVILQLCPTCNIYITPQPISKKVRDMCLTDYSCNDCVSNIEHTNPQ